MQNISLVCCLTSTSPVTGWNESFSRVCLFQNWKELWGAAAVGYSAFRVGIFIY